MVAIVQPQQFTLNANYPQNFIYFNGYESDYKWTLTDSCGNQDAGLDGNEQFGTWTDDWTGNDWGYPTATSTYRSDAVWPDELTASGNLMNPTVQNPQGGSTKIKHDYPFTVYIGSQSFGHGVVVHRDTQQYWRDHGTHF
jgi:hypothetical protein